jgi:hypothetical protein
VSIHVASAAAVGAERAPIIVAMALAIIVAMALAEWHMLPANQLCSCGFCIQKKPGNQ